MWKIGTIFLKPIKRINSSLRAKLMVIFFIATTIPISVVGLISYTKSFSTIWNNTTTSAIQIAEQLNINIELLFSDTEKFLEIANNENTIKFLKNTGDSYYEAKEILELFRQYRNSFKFSQSIKGIYIIGSDGKCISEKAGVYLLENKPQDSETYNEIIHNPGENQIIPSHTPDYGEFESKDEVISIGSTIIRSVTHEVLGVMIIDLDSSAITDFCKNMKIGKSGYFYLMDKNDKVVVENGRDLTGTTGNEEYIQTIFGREKGSFIETINNEKIFFVFNTSNNMKWKIIGRVQLRDLMRDAYDIRDMTIFTVILFILFAVIMYFFISDKLTKPLKDLKSKMKLAEAGNLDVRVESKSSDEIADLGDRFNSMIEKIKILIEEGIKEQKDLKKAELKVMQAQINPHFLYNTLDTIVWLAASKQHEKVIEIVDSLSSFFRITLSKGKDWITVKEEIDHIRNYLAIQKFRYRDIMDYEINVEPVHYDYKMLKLILQPLVENALYHGLKNRRTRNIGMITVNGFLNPSGDLQFEVIDNGIGMTEEKLCEIRKDLGDEIKGIEIKESGFGLNNVHRRISLYYGQGYGLSIESKYRKGTKITVIIRAEI